MFRYKFATLARLTKCGEYSGALGGDTEPRDFLPERISKYTAVTRGLYLKFLV